ncbi:MAG TPA: DUF4384 domain-containing protein [Noviherbaspirillum sp.]|uniref:DUF4384 domain-containing protein n=1 Tax=Noviherbaspirillum sp. TaxID=1926288 RepID=UPI002D3E6B00|nr:DUF4384 domain-containing protein [Noviherbaspirillum sp.]HYD97516.1 DUF4384 domain-containing protein [Noviherbaspirillum sp.]
MHARTRRSAAILVSVALLAGQFGCASRTLQFKEDVAQTAEEMRKGPETKPHLTETTFAQGLRCMDILFINYGVHDISMLIEDLSDQTSKVKAGTKDMFISAVSQMTRRSKAVRLVAFGVVTDTTLGAYIQNQSIKAFETVPEFSTRGSISQFDESMVKKQGDAGVSLGPLSSSVAKQASASIMGLDLNVIRTDDLSLVPGVTARNSVQILREGTGVDGELSFKKFGANFNYTMSRSEGQAQALRMLTELAAIELFGKLTKTPYWTCLGLTDKDPAVDAEMRDWWETFVQDPQSLVVYFQNQMRARGLYRGEVDGRANPAFIEAVRAYQQALGLNGDANVNFEFFRRYLAADHAKMQVKAKTMLKEVPVADTFTPPPPQAAAQTTVTIVNPQGDGRPLRRGEMYSVEVLLSQDSFMYCYLIDENGRISQFFPNPASPSAATKGGVKMRFPGNQPFRFVANGKSMTETVACYAAPQDLGARPLANAGGVANLNSLTDGFRKVAGTDVGVGVFNVKPQ